MNGNLYLYLFIIGVIYSSAHGLAFMHEEKLILMVMAISFSILWMYFTQDTWLEI